MEDNKYLIIVKKLLSTGLVAITILLDHGGQQIPDNREETPLHWACYNNNLKVVRLL